MSVKKEHSDKREVNTEREASLLETNRYGFILRNGETDSDCSDGPCPELVRHREAKWLGLIKHWEHVMEKKSSKVKGHCQKGIPASVRVKCWPLLCGALDKMKKNKNLYKNLVKAPDKQEWTDVIERDTGRQFPFHEMFQTKEGHGQKELLQVLKAYTQYRPEEGYCQGQGPVAAVLLINMPAEEAFWCLAQISELYLPGYYSPLLEGVLFDAGVLCSVLKKLCPTAHKHLEKHGVEPLMFATDWLMCLYSRHLPFNTLLRVWDLFFCYGVRILFQVAVVLVRRCLGKRRQRKQCDEQMETLERLRGVKEQIQNEQADIFIHEVCSVSLSLTDLQKLTEKEMDKWKKERPNSTFDPRERCHGYKMVWERAQVKPEEADKKGRHNRSQTLPLMRSHSSLSPSFLRKKWKKRSSKTDTEWNGGGRDLSLCILEETDAGDMRRRSVCGTIGELKVMQERLADEFHSKKGPIPPDSISAVASSCNKSVVFENQQTVCVSHQHPKRSVEQKDQETHLISNRNAEPHWDVKEKSIRCVADNEHTHHHESETEEKTIRDQNTEKQIDDVEQVMENKCLDENPKKQEPSSDDEKNMKNQECQEEQILDIQNTEEVHLVLTKEERDNNLGEREVQNEQKTDQVLEEQPIEHQDEQNAAVKRVLQNNQTEQNDPIKRHVRSSYHAVENRDHQDEEMPSNVQQICHLEQGETIRQFDHVETTHTNPDPAEDDQTLTQQKHSSEQEEKHPDTIQHYNDSSLLNLKVPHEEQAENQKHVQEEDTQRDDVQQYNQLEHLERREDVESENQDYSDAEKHDGCHPKPGFPMEPEKNVCVHNLEKECREDQKAKENNPNTEQTQNSESDLAAETRNDEHTVAHQAQFSKSELDDMDVKSMVSESETTADDGINTPEPEENLRLIISEENAIVEMTIVCQMAVTEESSQHHHNEEDYTCRSGHQDQNDVHFADSGNPERRNSFANPEIPDRSEEHLKTGSDNTEQTVEEFVVNISDIDGPVKLCNDLNPSSMSEDSKLNVELVTTPEFNVSPLAGKSEHNDLNPTNVPENQEVSEERVNISEINAIELAGPVKPQSDAVNPIGCGSPETDMECVVTSGNSVDSEVTESNNQTNPELHKTHMSGSDDVGPQDCKTQATEEPVFSNISMSLNENVPPAQLCRRRASSSRASYPTILSEDTFRVPRASWLVDSVRSVNQTDSLESTQEPCPLPDTHKKPNSSKPLRLFQRFWGEGNKTPIPKILIQDFSEKEERLTAKERRKAEQQQKEEEKERKRQEKKAEKERKKPQTRGKSFQLLSRTSGGREGSSEQRNSQDLSPRRNSDYF